MRSLGRETLAIIGATIALAALILTGTAGVRGEFQTVRDELRAEARTDRESFQSHVFRSRMGAPRDLKDRIGKRLFRNPRMVRDMLGAFVPARWTADIDADTLGIIYVG